MEVKKFQHAEASLYTLRNAKGMEVVLTDIGASVVSIIVPDSEGKPVDVALGYGTAESYLSNKSTFGATVGRYANRIGGASFTLDGVTYQLDCNEGSNVLHGGFNKYYYRIWKAEPNSDDNSVTFHLTSPDGDQGMPGTAQIAVTYSLDNDCRLKITYHAVSDKDTYFNLTNHSYFNLDGHDAGSIYDHLLWLDCDLFAVIDEASIPTGELRSVKGTPMDFTTAKPIGQDIDASEYEQIKAGSGYDHNYVINHPDPEKPFARAVSDKTGIVMEVFTDLPGVQFYSGNFMGNDSDEKNGAKYKRRGGFCLETQYYPDTPNKPEFPSNMFPAGKSFDSTTIYQFS